MDLEQETEQASNAVAKNYIDSPKQDSLGMETTSNTDMALETDSNEPDTQEVVASVIEKDKSLKGVLDTSVDSGIHDVLIKQAPVDDCEHPDTAKTKEPLEDACTDTNVETNVIAHDVTKTSLENSPDSNVRAENNASTEKENKEGSFSCGSITSNKANLIENEVNTNKSANATNDLKAVQTEKASDTNKDMEVEEKGPNASDTDVIVVEGASTMMDYRTAEKVITVDDTSDSSADSSDSDDDATDNKKETEAKNTEAQINKIISNEREASPEREKRVKLNRHGFEDIRTKGELQPEDLPPLEELTITVDDTVVMVEVGNIKSIVGILVVIQSNENVPPLDDETILFVEGHKVLGQVFEVFGPVKTPWYSVRFNEASNIEAKGLKEGMPVFCAPREDSFTKFVFVDSLKRVKGSDASWEDNNEPPEKHLDYSDDESERRAKAKRRNKKFGDHETEGGGDGDNNVQRKNPRQRNRSRGNRDDQSGAGPQQQMKHSKRGWNPFQENQNEHTNNMPPRFGGRQQNNGHNSQASGQRWTPSRDNFNRPQSRFGGPPDFQNRPRTGQNQGRHQFGGRNFQHQNNWRPPPNTNCPDNMQNSGQPSMNGPCPADRPFNLQSPPPSMGTSGFCSNSQNGPPGPMNVNFPQPPPQFQAGNQIRPPNQQAGMNPWMRPPASINLQNASFIANKLPNANNQSALQGNQTMNQLQMNAGNQTFNQGQPNNVTAYQGNQSNITHPVNNTPQTSQGNFSNFGMNIGQNQFNQPPPNSRPNSMPQVQPEQNVSTNFQQNYSQFQTNGFSGQSSFPSGNNTDKSGSGGPNFIPACNNNFQSGEMNPGSYNGQSTNIQRQELGHFQMQNNLGQPGFNNIQNRQCGENQNFVQNQNFRNNPQNSFPQGSIPNGSSGNQFIPQGYGFQNNFIGQNQPAGQGGFNPVSGTSYPCTGNSFVPAGNSVGGPNQMQGTVQPNIITDQRFIQNNS
ncbi:H/ACA ribonucleoprotein complex non-core subunit NAF1-like [Mercenaria mercenaria]|uniref:H/ACA ribonucleoprotein complex non-core subunit NAF1-like n=1 Tax=Mercenaria mercenaria TaxID=6596 RepID=UPI00234F79CA|nr:H/ACA ribonucleoprotein complex non-core subunit NAF1-like [Mercenaria mercenaria]XP_053392453.1 H/ACA ribonucleoprotein complex non-core subunit NAF1-like [Mercenaria mercenaria]